MNRFKVIVLLAFLAVGHTAFPQAHLQITRFAGLPVFPGDTAVDSIPYNNIYITVTNTGNQPYFGWMDVLLRANPGVTDTLYSDTLNNQLQPSDTILLHPSSYRFSPVHFDGGDNIVVVWPVAHMTGVSSDTTTVHIYFLGMTGIFDPVVQPLGLYPNPAGHLVYFDIPDKNYVKHVRIYDPAGTLFYRDEITSNRVLLPDCPPGIYFIELMQQDGTRRIGKILKY